MKITWPAITGTAETAAVIYAKFAKNGILEMKNERGKVI